MRLTTDSKLKFDNMKKTKVILCSLVLSLNMGYAQTEPMNASVGTLAVIAAGQPTRQITD